MATLITHRGSEAIPRSANPEILPILSGWRGSGFLDALEGTPRSVIGVVVRATATDLGDDGTASFFDGWISAWLAQD
jgi:hypothetical protein